MNKMLGLLCAVVLSLALSGCKGSGGKVVARVGGETITMDDLEKELKDLYYLPLRSRLDSLEDQIEALRKEVAARTDPRGQQTMGAIENRLDEMECRVTELEQEWDTQGFADLLSKLEKGLANSISASSFTPKDPGAFIVGATLPAENLEKAMEAILKEIHDIGRDGVSAEELSRVKVNVESELIYDRQTVQGQARKLGYYEVITGDIQFEKEYVNRIGLLRSEDIEKALEKYFKASRMVISILAPHEKKDFSRAFP
jgi:outer membrane murein-binding lipoprotein Lpp